LPRIVGSAFSREIQRMQTVAGMTLKKSWRDLNRAWFVVVGGMMSFALVSEGATRVVAWGDMSYDVAITLPPSGKGTVRISAGDFHSLALNLNGAVMAWGDDQFNQTNIPAALLSAPAACIAAGNVHNLALMQDTTVIAWGPEPGQTGDYGQCAVPIGLTGVVAVAAGAAHSLALLSDGTVAAWGLNWYGQCDVPTGLTGAIDLAGGMYHSLTLMNGGTVIAWGDNRHGQTAVPPGLSNVVAIAAGGYHSLALRNDGTVVSWGSYGLLQVGVPDGLTNVVAIATGDYHSLALKADGTLVPWGLNSAGQCNIPTGLNNVATIAARGNHSMVLIDDMPTLKIGAAAGQVVLSWPGLPSGFSLRQSSDLSSGNWLPVTNTPTISNGQSTLTLPAGDKMFYRLVGQ
jgi:hypothetical protein